MLIIDFRRWFIVLRITTEIRCSPKECPRSTVCPGLKFLVRFSDATVDHKDIYSLATTNSCSRPKATNRSRFNIRASDTVFLLPTFHVMFWVEAGISLTRYNEVLADWNLTIWSDKLLFELHSSLILCKKLDKIGQTYERILSTTLCCVDCCLSAGIIKQGSLTLCSVISHYWSNCKVYIIAHNLK